MHSIFTFLEKQPFILLFFIVSVGYWASKIKIKGIGFGMVASSLIMGMFFSFWAASEGKISFELPQLLQSIFFNIYIFCVGLRVGPQCFAGLEKNGKQFLGIGFIAVILTPILAIMCGLLFKLDAGTVAGVLSGSNTASASFGAAQSAAVPEMVGQNAQALASNLSVSFALGYAFSLILFVLGLPYLPKLTGSHAKAAAQDLDRKRTIGLAPLPQTQGSLETPFEAPIDIRVYRIQTPTISGRTIASLIEQFPRVSIEQVRRNGRMLPVTGNLALQMGDELAIGAAIQSQLRAISVLGTEINAPEMMAWRPQTADIVITKPELAGKTLLDLQRGVGHGLYYSAAFRMGTPLALGPQTEFKRHDVLRVTGSRAHVATLKAAAGAAVEPSISTDILSVAIGLLLGGLVGAITIPIAGIKLGVGTATGLLLVSIVMSWLRTRYPNLGGPFPEPARKLMEDLGLSIFIAIVGLNAGPGLVKALGAGTVGPILASVLIVGFVPPVLIWFIGIKWFKLNPALLMGAVAGARQTSPGIEVSQEAVSSSVPAEGFPVPFTLATLIFTFYGYLFLVLWPIR